jgi:hypothetical protein
MVAVLLHRFGFRVVVAEKQMPTTGVEQQDPLHFRPRFGF